MHALEYHSQQSLHRQLVAMNGRGYKAYKALCGPYAFDDYTLFFDHVQGDSFALPSRISLHIPLARLCLDPDLYRGAQRYTACMDFLGRAIAAAIPRYTRGKRGSGNSGQVVIAPHGQEVLRRNAVLIRDDQLEARLRIGLPADGRRISADEAIAMLFEELPALVQQALLPPRLDIQALRRHVECVEDQQYLRQWLRHAGLIAFIATGARLARASGIKDEPMPAGQVPLRAPAGLLHEVALPNAGLVQGMGIPPGLTLIVGGGFHGKSTLLHALERGVYDHRPGDGREQVVTREDAVKVRAEDGRAVSSLDISAFIGTLPFGKTTACFSTDNASGSTSQASGIIEALLGGCRLLLMDEDTSATNFMIRDACMEQLVGEQQEPITPYLYRVRELYERHGISSIIVMGGSSAYFPFADTVVCMREFQPEVVTDRARQLALDLPAHAATQPMRLPDQTTRSPAFILLDPRRGRHAVRFDVYDRRRMRYGEQEVDLSALEQLVDAAQTRAIAWILTRLYKELQQGRRLYPALDALFTRLADGDLDSITDFKVGDLAMPRRHEVAAAINRLRGAQWQDSDDNA